MKTSKDMLRVEDKKQFKSLLYENLRRFPRWETNCIFEPGEVDRLLPTPAMPASICWMTRAIITASTIFSRWTSQWISRPWISRCW